MFIGRRKELDAMQSLYDKDGFGMMVIYGRRRIGKSTLINILSGLYTNYTGYFNINKNYNFRNINQKEYIEKIGYISQRTEMF